MRYLALGDSYTIGESVSAHERFPVQLARRLREQGIQIDEPQIIARTGWTTDELERAILQNPPPGPFDLVTLLIGVNNQYRGRDAEEYRREFVGLLERAIAFAGNNPARVIVISIPDWGMTPFGRNRKNVSAEIDMFNAINQSEATARGVHYVNITPISRKAENDTSLIAGDGLHPSGKMYSQWVDLLLPIAQRILASSQD
ncbi:MAG TPA: SGNH/GDSL hydrolase family protein [Anaerolineae bacterium]|nr:SGNH/GDSL hydrolase family protein [Anaerolineae bacterium]